MKYTEFISRLKEARPDIIKVTAHAGYRDSRNKNSVGIVFKPDGKVYEYTGSYTDILEQLGILRQWAVAGYGEVLARYYTEAEAQKRAEQERAQEQRMEAAGWGKAREITVSRK